MDLQHQNSKLPVLRGSGVIVRMASEEDVESIINFYQSNKEHLAAFEPKRKLDFYTEDYWKNQIFKNLEEFHADQSLRMFIFDQEIIGKIIGVINFNQIVRGVFHACYLGYSLAKDYQGRGVMSKSLQLAINYVFSELNIHRIMANYMPHNQKSGMVLKRLGFHVEGYARDYLYINGRWEDHILTSLTNHEWENGIK